MDDAGAQINIAVIYAWGAKIIRNKPQAYVYLKKALKSGKSEASVYLERLCKESAWACQDQ
jgi:TPR repeat protein